MDADRLAPARMPGGLLLEGGLRLTVQPITPASKPMIAAAMARLSPESIRRRFHAPRRELSEAELHRLTSLDGWNHYALGACTSGAGGTAEGVAVARFARTEPGGESAEVAITVVDALHGRGIGRALLQQIVEAARARGVRRLHAAVLPDNAPVIALLRRLAPWARWRRDGYQLVADIPLPEPLRPPLTRPFAGMARPLPA
jgi:GNAT superfamily N-acetyltransferase